MKHFPFNWGNIVLAAFFDDLLTHSAAARLFIYRQPCVAFNDVALTPSVVKLSETLHFWQFLYESGKGQLSSHELPVSYFKSLCTTYKGIIGQIMLSTVHRILTKYREYDRVGNDAKSSWAGITYPYWVRLIGYPTTADSQSETLLYVHAQIGIHRKLCIGIHFLDTMNDAVFNITRDLLFE